MSIEPSRIEGILVPATPAGQAEQESRVRSSFFETLKRAARHVPFMDDVAAAYFCALDPETPSATKGVLLAALAYFVLPIDIVPDFILGLGFTDDVAVLWVAFQAVRSSIAPRHYDKARAALGEMKGAG